MPDLFNPSAGMFPQGASSLLQNPMIGQMVAQGGPQSLAALLQNGGVATGGSMGLPMPPPMQPMAPMSPSMGLPMSPPMQPQTPMQGAAAPAPGSTAAWQSYQPNIFGFEGGNGAVGNGGGVGQFEPEERAAFVKANPQFAGVPVTAPNYQDAAYKWMGNQITSAVPQASNDPGAFYASYSLGPTAAKALMAAPPNASASAVIGAMPDGATLIKGNPELFRGNASVADALTRAGAIAQGKWGPSVGMSGAAPGAPGAPQTPLPGSPGADPSASGLMNQILGKLPAGGPGLSRVGGIATNPLFAAGAAGLAQEPSGSAGSIIGHMGQAYQQAALQKPLINNQVALQGYNAGLERAKDATQLGMLGAYKPMSFGGQIYNPQTGAISQTMTNGWGKAMAVPIAGPGGTANGQAGFVPDSLATPTISAAAHQDTEAFKGNLGEYQTDLAEIPGQSAEIQDNNQLITNLSDPQTAASMGPGAIKEAQRSLVTAFPSLSGVVGFTNQGLQTNQNVIAQLREGSLGALKKVFGARVTNLDTKLLAPIAIQIANSPNVAISLVKAANAGKQVDLQTNQQMSTYMAGMGPTQRRQFLTQAGGYTTLYNSYYTANFQKAFSSPLANPKPEIGMTNGQPSSNVGATQSTAAPKVGDAAAAAKQAHLNSILYGN